MPNHSRTKKNREKPRKGDNWIKRDYKSYVYDLLSNCASDETYRRTRVAEGFDLFYNKFQSREFDNLLGLHEGDKDDKGSTPFVRTDFGTAAQKISLLMGDLRNRGFVLNVDCTNIESVRRKQAFERQLRFLAQTQPMMRRAAQVSGIEVAVNDNVPVNEDQLQQHLNEYRDIYAMLVYDAINEEIKTHKYEHARKTMFLDYLCTNEIHIRANEPDPARPPWRRVNPLNAIWDTSTEDDLVRDGMYFAEAYYIPIPTAMKRYNIQPDEMSEIIKRYNNGKGGWQGHSYSIAGGGSILGYAPFERRSGGWNDFEYDRILIVEAEWLSNNDLYQKVTHVDNEDGTSEFVHTYVGHHRAARLTQKEGQDARNSIDKTELEIVRHACLIGGDYLYDYGIRENKIRKKTAPHLTDISYQSLVGNYNNQVSVGFADRLKGLEALKNYYATLLQKELTSDMGNLVYLDVAKLSEKIYGKGDEAVKKVLLMAKGYNIVLGDSAKDNAMSFTGANGSGQPIQHINSTSMAKVAELTNVIMFLDEQIDRISGIDKSRSGNVGARTGAAVTQMNLSQSNAITEHYFQNFETWESLFFEKLAIIIANDWIDHPEKYEEIAARRGMTLPDDFEVDMQTYRVVVNTNAVSASELRQYIQFAVQQGSLDPVTALEIGLMMKGDFHGALKKFIKEYRERQDQAQQAQAAAEKQAQQLEMQGRQMDHQSKIEQIREKGRIDKEIKAAEAEMQQSINRLTLEQKDREVDSVERTEINKNILSDSE